jgi:hypothetical protein
VPAEQPIPVARLVEQGLQAFLPVYKETATPAQVVQPEGVEAGGVPLGDEDRA